ncbi:uncharacterized protein [Aegilops tauschii subsp. strangulata]|uniref:uncharacterized protein n=1 Tax=Aegilops tauschii subsp. strangulata TaxID=200361 RepID=UPI003CC8C539
MEKLKESFKDDQAGWDTEKSALLKRAEDAEAALKPVTVELAGLKQQINAMTAAVFVRAASLDFPCRHDFLQLLLLQPLRRADPADIRDINIHEHVPVVLDATDATYFAWKTYFSLLFHENNLVDHVDGFVDSRAMVGDSEWTAIDAMLIRWVFTTISKGLFHTVVSDGDDARAMWVKLNGLFTDNKLQRRVFLQQEFFDCHQDDQSIDDYCRRLKTLADELRDIGAKVDDDLLLSTLTAALTRTSVMPPPTSPSTGALLPQVRGILAVGGAPDEGGQEACAAPRPRRRHLVWCPSTGRPARACAPPPAGGPRASGVLPPPARASRPTRCPQQPQQGGGRRGNRRGGGRKQAQGGPSSAAAAGHPALDLRHQPMDGRRTRVLDAGSSGSRFGHPWASAGEPLGALHCAERHPYSGYGAAPAYGTYGAAPTPAYGGFLPPQVPLPWDLALLAALHSAPSPSSYGGGGDWYMDSGATAHMTAHPVTNPVSVRRLARENPITVEFDDIGFSVKDTRTRMFGRPILALQTDNGKEFDNAAVRNLLASHGTIFRLTCPYMSQQNGRAESVIRTLNDCVRTLLFHSYVPPRFWPDALVTANLLINIRPCRPRWNYTPHRLLFGTVTLGVPRGAVRPCLHLWRTAPP